MRALFRSVSTTGVILLVNVITGVVLARVLGVAERGELAAALLWPTLLSVIGSLGVNQAATFHTARRTGSPETIIGSALALVICLSAPLMAIGFFLLPPVLSDYDSMTLETARLNLTFIPISLTTLALAAVINGLHRATAFQYLRFAVVLLPLPVLILLAVVGELTPRSAVITYLAGNIGTGLAAAWMLRKQIGRARVNRLLMRRLISFGLRSQLSGAPAYLNHRLDQLVVSVALGPATLGLYVVAATMATLPIAIGVSAAIVALPAIAATRPGPPLRERVRFYASLTLLTSAALSLSMATLAPQLVDLLFGSEFAGAVDVTRILLIGTVAYSLNRTLEATLQGLGDPLAAGIGETTGLIAGGIALAVFVPMLGLVGAGLASALASAISTGYLLRKTAASLQCDVRALLIPRRSWLQGESLAELAHPEPQD